MKRVVVVVSDELDNKIEECMRANPSVWVSKNNFIKSGIIRQLGLFGYDQDRKV